MGSNLANIGLILGLTALVRPLAVRARVVRREMPLMVLVTLALYPLAWDGELGRGDGVLLLFALAGYLIFVFYSVEDEAPEILGEYEEFMKESDRTTSLVSGTDMLWVIAGSACLVLGGICIVEGAVGIAGALGISEVIIGLTVVAVGTSLPELATSLVAVLRNEADIAVGNVIGSNIFNVAAILGTASVVSPLAIPSHVLPRELAVVVAMSLLLFPVLRSRWCIRRWEGGLLLACYVGAVTWLV
jgi:cation:H+ antiporter